jgi:hypothetical protein
MSDFYPWLTAYRDGLGKRLANGSLPHAVLITGQSGMGKLALAVQLVGLLLCEQRGSSHTPCGRCGCRMFAASAHPDYVLVTQKLMKIPASSRINQGRPDPRLGGEEWPCRVIVLVTRWRC